MIKNDNFASSCNDFVILIIIFFKQMCVRWMLCAYEMSNPYR